MIPPPVPLPRAGLLRGTSIRLQLSMLAGVLSALLLGMGVFALYELSAGQSRVESLYTHRVLPLRQLKTISDMYAVEIVDNAHKARNGNVPAAHALARVRRAKREIATTWRAFVPSYLTDEEQRLMAQIIPLLQVADTSSDRLAAILDAGDAPALDAYVRDDLYRSIEPISETVNRLANLQLELARRDHRESLAAYARAFRLLLGSILLGLLAGAAVAYSVIRGVVASLRSALQAAEHLARGDIEVDVPPGGEDEVGRLMGGMREVVESERAMAAVAECIADGDLRAEVHPRSGSDRLGKAFAVMAGKLAEVIGEVGAGSQALAAASGQIADTAQSLAFGANEQVTAVERTGGGLASMGGAIARAAAYGGEMEELALRSAGEAEEAGRAMHDAMSVMRRIAEKVSLIEDLAAQTNTLALVAGVEAARAGDHGRGFAEVATEVRKLAERSREAATEIAGLARGSVETAQTLGDRIRAMVPLSRRTAEMVKDVSALGRNLTAKLEEISGSMERVHAVALDAASATQELAATSQELSAQAWSLQRMVAYFRTGAENDAPLESAGSLPPAGAGRA